MYLIAKSKLKNEDDIADCIQETIYRAYKHIKKLKNNSSFKAWIIKILINEINRTYKKKSKNEISIEDNSLENVIGTGNNLEDNINFSELIKNLSEEEQKIFILFYVSNFTTKEIAKILHKNENTIRVKIMRGKNKLRKLMEGGVLYEF